MMVLGRLQGSLLVVCAIALSLFFFAGGFAMAVYLGGMDVTAATAVAGTVLNRSEYLAMGRRGLANDVSRMAKRPMFALSTFAARPVQGLYKKVPGSLRPLSPQNALDETLRLRQAEVDTAVAGGAQNLSGAVQSATMVNVPPGTPGAAPAATAGADPAAAASNGAAPGAAASGATAAPGAAAPGTAAPGVAAPVAAAAPPAVEVPRRVLPAPVPAGGGMYAIELASFRQAESANAFIAEMQRRKLAVSLVGEIDASGREWQHVRLGPYPTEEQAASRLADLRQVQGLPGVIVQEPVTERRS